MHVGLLEIFTSQIIRQTHYVVTKHSLCSHQFRPSEQHLGANAAQIGLHTYFTFRNKIVTNYDLAS